MATHTWNFKLPPWTCTRFLCVPVSGLASLLFMLTLYNWQPPFQMIKHAIETDRTFTYSFTETVPKEVSHVGFLKVHKAGSCTVQNIFFRFGIKRNLTFVFPRKGHYFMNRDDIMPVKDKGPYDLLATHSVFTEDLFTVLPSDSVNVAIIREPLDRMISAAYYFRDVFGIQYLKNVPTDNFIYNLVNNSEKYDKGYYSYTKNSLGKDFGFSASVNDEDAINHRMEYLDKRFKLVMLTERFEESLILLKRILHWGLNDILYSNINSHKHKPVANITSEMKDKYRETSSLDYKIYDTFKAKLNQLVEREGPDFQQEVFQFKAILAQTGAFCNNTTRLALGKSLTVPMSRWNPIFLVSPRDCELMTMKVEPFIQLMRDRHAEMNNPPK